MGTLSYLQVYLEFGRSHFTLISEYLLRSVEWKGICVCVYVGLLLFFVCVVFYSLSVLTIFTIASAFHCRVNDRQLWKEVAMTCDFGIHGLEHYIHL